MPPVFFFLKTLSAVYGLLWVHAHFRTVWFISVENAFGVGGAYFESVDCFGQHGHFNNINFSNRQHEVPFHFHLFCNP